MIKIVFFDVDGTLLKMGCKEMSKKTICALNQLKKNGIKIFIATGRPACMAPHFKEVEFDGMLSYSGQLCTDESGIIYSNEMNKEDVLRVYENSKKMNIPLAFADDVSCQMTHKGERLQQYIDMVNVHMGLMDNVEEFLTHPIFQIVAAIDKEDEKILLEGTTSLQPARWCDIACDIIPSSGGKEIGIEKILDHYGYTKEESMSFGDGGNDKTMLENTGIGVAMGNAKDEVKEIADYITLNVEEEGIYDALLHFELIDSLDDITKMD